jgi:hypothetical protein
MRVERTVALGIVVACGIAGGGCGGVPPGPTATAVIQMTVNPPTLTPAVCPPSHCGPLEGQLEVTATLTIRETAGVAGAVNRVGMVLRRQSDNASVAQTEQSPVGRLAGLGSITVPIAMHYDRSAGEANMKVVLTIEARDDNGHTINSTMEVPVLSSGLAIHY